MASAGDWDPRLETDPTPPPLLRPRPEHLIFGTTSTGADEAVLNPQHHPLTAYTGTGAYEAAAALALSALSSQPEHRLIITERLARDLLGIGADPADSTWLTLTPDTSATLRAATDAAQVSERTTTLAIADAETAGIFQITAALAADRGRNRLALLLLGDVTRLAALSPTTIDIDRDGQPRSCAGPQAAAFHQARFHTLPPATAADLYRVLHHHRAHQPAPRVPAQVRDDHQAHPAGPHPEPDSADDEHHPSPANPVSPGDETSQEQPRGVRTATPTAVCDPAPSAAAAVSPLLLRVLGPLTFENADGRTLPGPTGRSAQLLTYLAIHPRGRTLRQITADIWNSSNPSGANSTLVRVRRDLHNMIMELAPDLILDGAQDHQAVILEPHGTYRLDRRLINADYIDFEALEDAARREKVSTRRADLASQALAYRRGEPAEGLSENGQVWLTEARVDLELRVHRLHQFADLPGNDDTARAGDAHRWERILETQQT